MSSEQDDVRKWLESHYQASRVSGGNNNGELIHVFAVQRGPVFGEPSKNSCYDISFGLGPATFRVEACFDMATGEMSICVFVKIPFFPEYKLGCATGSFSEGVTIKFDWKIVSGLFTFYVKDKWLWLHYEVKVFGKTYSGDFKLIPLP